MSIMDWLKEIPLSAVLKERLIQAQTEIADLKAKNVVLELKISELQKRLDECEKKTKNAPQFMPVAFPRRNINRSCDGY